MPSKREQVLAALFARLTAGLGAVVSRNEALPERVRGAGGGECNDFGQARAVACLGDDPQAFGEE